MVLQTGIDIAQQDRVARCRGDRIGIGIPFAVDQPVFGGKLAHIEANWIGIKGRVNLAQHQDCLIGKGSVGVRVGL